MIEVEMDVHEIDVEVEIEALKGEISEREGIRGGKEIREKDGIGVTGGNGEVREVGAARGMEGHKDDL